MGSRKTPMLTALQWSLTLSSEETILVTFLICYWFMLQWSLTLSSEETPYGVGSSFLPYGFNGASLFRVRKPEMNTLLSRAEELQWSLTLSSEETSIQVGWSGFTSQLQWSLTLSSEETRKANFGGFSKSRRFNGASLFRVRKPCSVQGGVGK